MRKLRGLFYSLGLVMTGIMASEARAESLMLSVFAGTDTTVAPVYTILGGANSVSANTDILNSNLDAAGYGAYTFSNLGGSSNYPGTSQAGVGAYILTSGDFVVTHGGSGEGTPITVVLTEAGFTLPATAPYLQDTSVAIIAGATGS